EEPRIGGGDVRLPPGRPAPELLGGDVVPSPDHAPDGEVLPLIGVEDREGDGEQDRRRGDGHGGDPCRGGDGWRRERPGGGVGGDWAPDGRAREGGAGRRSPADERRRPEPRLKPPPASAAPAPRPVLRARSPRSPPAPRAGHEPGTAASGGPRAGSRRDAPAI